MTHAGFQNLTSRVLIGSSMLGFILGLTYSLTHPLMGLLFTGVLSGVAVTALWEYYQLCRTKGAEPLFSLAAFITVLMMVGRYYGLQQGLPFSYDRLFLGAFLALLTLHYLFRDQHPLENTAYTGFGLLYVTLPLSLILDLVFGTLPVNNQWTFVFLLLATKGADTFAYFVGRSFGKRPLAPTISPKKTYEGGVAALVGGGVLGFLWAYAAPIFFTAPAAFSNSEAFCVGATLAVAGQLGDLVESNFKREAQVKDSNRIPGLGGLLDMVDSLLLAVPLLYFYLQHR